VVGDRRLVMESDERQLMLTAAWIFARHGQGARARVLCEALVEDDPHDGVAAAALAEQMLSESEPAAALKILRGADFTGPLQRPAALLETRALRMLGRNDEADRRWKRYLDSQNRNRKWVAGNR